MEQSVQGNILLRHLLNGETCQDRNLLSKKWIIGLLYYNYLPVMALTKFIRSSNEFFNTFLNSTNSSNTWTLPPSKVFDNVLPPLIESTLTAENNRIN